MLNGMNPNWLLFLMSFADIAILKAVISVAFINFMTEIKKCEYDNVKVTLYLIFIM